MPELRPFAGIRYSATSELSRIVCPPYDIISTDDQASLRARHPHNAVRLEGASSSSAAEKYRETAATFRGWLETGVLARDDAAGLYVYRQDFLEERASRRSRHQDGSGGRRRVTGVIGALPVAPFGPDPGVLPHEQTMPGPKQDRLALLRACRANFSPIYAIYRGAGALEAFYETLADRPTAARVADDDNILHRLWVTRAPAEIDLLSEAVRQGPLVIADGHHRYETALAYHLEQESGGEHDAVMCLCVDADSEGLVVLPYHRCLRAKVEPGEIERRLRDAFEVRDIEPSAAEATLREPGVDHLFVFVLAKRALAVRVSTELVEDRLQGHRAAWRSLDVVALHEVVLPELLPEVTPELGFSKDAAEIRGMVEQGWTAGVLMRPLDPAQVVDVATSGERMPQKASYFWPKAITGLVFRSLD